MPGDPVDLLIPAEAPRAVAEQLRARFGLDQPLYVQYILWLKNVIQGDFGVSIFTLQPVAPELFSALKNTLKIAIYATILGFGVGSILGTLSAINYGKPLDKIFSAIAIAGVSLPHFWIGMVLVAIFSAHFNLLPAQGMAPPEAGFIAGIKHLLLPVITLSLIPIGVVSRVSRASILDVKSLDFVDTLRAKGLLEKRVMIHIIKNAAPPILAVMGLQFGYMLGGSILIETVFNWPGAGNLLNLAIFRRDIPTLQATILVLAAIFVIVNILVDILQALIDPRIRR